MSTATVASVAVATGSVRGQESGLEQATRSGLAAYKQGNDAQAESWLRIALKEAEKLTPADPNLPKSLHNLAMVLSSEGKLAEAEQLIRRALALREAPGKPSEDIAVSLNNLAILLYEQQRYLEAGEVLRRALLIDAKILPDDHKERVVSLENYAKVLRKLNNYDEADRVESLGGAYRPPADDGSARKKTEKKQK
jgi:tetratricopeptide (TPR) repeat protein